VGRSGRKGVEEQAWRMEGGCERLYLFGGVESYFHLDWIREAILGGSGEDVFQIK